MSARQNCRKLQFSAIEIYSVSYCNASHPKIKLKKLGSDTSLYFRYISLRRLNPFTFASLYTENVFISIMAHTSEKLTWKKGRETRNFYRLADLSARSTSRICWIRWVIISHISHYLSCRCESLWFNNWKILIKSCKEVQKRQISAGNRTKIN